jgi:Mg2+/Co2+ transporter CorB
MHWLYLVVGVVCMIIASLPKTPEWAVVVLVLGALVLFLAWMISWMASRVGDNTRHEMQILSADELRQMREQAEARKAAAAAPPVVADDDNPPG